MLPYSFQKIMIVQFRKAVLSGHVIFVDLAKSVEAPFGQPFQYLVEHSKNVWTGKPSDQEAFEYGKSMGNAINIIIDVVGGGTIEGAKIVQALSRVCPKLMKAVDKVVDAIRGTGKYADDIAEGVGKSVSQLNNKLLYRVVFEGELNTLWNLKSPIIQIFRWNYCKI